MKCETFVRQYLTLLNTTNTNTCNKKYLVDCLMLQISSLLPMEEHPKKQWDLMLAVVVIKPASSIVIQNNQTRNPSRFPMYGARWSAV